VFTLQDTGFAVPGSSGCGRLTGSVDRRLGLPAPTGNAMTLHAAYTYRTYDALDR
jgi:hypothetical protein